MTEKPDTDEIRRLIKGLEPTTHFDRLRVMRAAADELDALRAELAEANAAIARKDSLLTQQAVDRCLVADLDEANARIAELEAENERLRAALRECEVCAVQLHQIYEFSQLSSVGDVVDRLRAVLGEAK